jgi:HAD superfamily hydrolase (TIGR01458 family)
VETKAFLIDLDGVLYVGGHAVAGAVSAIDLLESHACQYRFVSNTTRKCRATIAERLDRLGFSIPVSRIFTPTIAAIAAMQQTESTRCLLLTTGDVNRDFAAAGIQNSEREVDFIVVGDAGENFTYRNLNLAMRLVLGGAGILALERDRYWIGADGLMLSAGPFVAALEYATGTRATVVGKPAPEFFALALRNTGVKLSEAAMIGDDILTDIGGAQNAGMQGILVRTGKYRADAVAASGIMPDRTIDSIAQIGELL